MTHEIGTINYDHHLQFRKLFLRSGTWQAQALKIDLFDFKTCSPHHCAILTLRTRQIECEPKLPKERMVLAARPFAAMIPCPPPP